MSLMVVVKTIEALFQSSRDSMIGRAQYNWQSLSIGFVLAFTICAASLTWGASSHFDHASSNRIEWIVPWTIDRVQSGPQFESVSDALPSHDSDRAGALTMLEVALPHSFAPPSASGQTSQALHSKHPMSEPASVGGLSPRSAFWNSRGSFPGEEPLPTKAGGLSVSPDVEGAHRALASPETLADLEREPEHHRVCEGVIAHSDAFKFSYFGLVIGEVLFEYEKAVECELGEDSAALVSTLGGGSPADAKPDSLAKKNTQDDFGAYPDPQRWQLVRVKGKTNGLVRWLKTYEGIYDSAEMPSEVDYTVEALDRGVREVRRILFRKVEPYLPEVLAFSDRTQEDALVPMAGLDEFSLDPVGLMRTVLLNVSEANSCSLKTDPLRIFDGKRRYRASLSPVDASELVVGASDNDAEAPVRPRAHDPSATLAAKTEPVKAQADGTHSLTTPNFATDSIEEPKQYQALSCRVTLRSSIKSIPESGSGADEAQGAATQDTGEHQATLFWPFNQKELSFVLDMDQIDRSGLRYQSFIIESPFGTIKGKRVAP